MRNRIKTRNSPDMLLGMILQFESLRKSFDETSASTLVSTGRRVIIVSTGSTLYYEGIIGEVGLCITVNSEDSQLIVDTVGTYGYVDLIYLTRGIVTKQFDMYSFGVVLLEVLCGRFVKRPPPGKVRASLVDMAEHHLTDNQPYQIIAQYLMKEVEDEKFKDSVKTYAAITRECLHSTETRCFTMADVVKQLKRALTFHLIGVEIISLKEIKAATNCFSEESVIGKGSSGKVYKGKLYPFNRSMIVAVKRLDKVGSYGEGALLKEVVKLYQYSHENIIAIRGFCEEDNERIIIMDHASNESLDRHLDKSSLTWGIRLKISIGAAKGLNHIHSFKEDQKTLHGDIKSSNILLDHDWEAAISNFIISKSHGTLGYLDPQSYHGVTKKSDVYSFGVVLFEILSGKLAIEKAEKYSHHTLRQIINDERERYAGDGAEDTKVVFLAWMAARCFEENKLEALIFDDLKEQTDAKSIDVVSKVAYQCLNKDQEKRRVGMQKLPEDYERIMKMIENLESQIITKKDLYSLLFTGTRLNNGEVWLSLSKDGKVNEMISATTFSYENCWSSELKVLENSRSSLSYTYSFCSQSSNDRYPQEVSRSHASNLQASLIVGNLHRNKPSNFFCFSLLSLLTSSLAILLFFLGVPSSVSSISTLIFAKACGSFIQAVPLLFPTTSSPGLPYFDLCAPS
ncbi:phloem protein 2-like protein [Tanacetum coccineum]